MSPRRFFTFGTSDVVDRPSRARRGTVALSYSCQQRHDMGAHDGRMDDTDNQPLPDIHRIPHTIGGATRYAGVYAEAYPHVKQGMHALLLDAIA